jgi:ABC-type siderophore export system fused ATPase/permease subunit
VYCCDIQIYQAVKDVSASYDALVDLLESIEQFLCRLDIYTKISPTMAMAEMIVKIMVEILSTLALVTKQVRQKRPSESDLFEYPVDLNAAQ